MKIIHAAIIDDDAIQRLALEKMLHDYGSENEIKWVLFQFESAESFYFEFIENKHWDLLFLDIEMKEQDGMQLAKQIRTSGIDVPIIFVTAYAQYALEGYQVQAFDYLLKPVSPDNIRLCCDRFMDSLSHKEEPTIIVPHNSATIRIKERDVLYCEANDHSTNLYLIDQTILLSERFGIFCQRLSKSFVLTHRSYCVNLVHVKQIRKDEVVLDNKVLIPLSRSNFKSVNNAFISHYRKGGYTSWNT